MLLTKIQNHPELFSFDSKIVYFFVGEICVTQWKDSPYLMDPNSQIRNLDVPVKGLYLK